MVLGKEGRCKGRVGTEERGKRECVCVLGGGYIQLRWHLGPGGGKIYPQPSLGQPFPEPGIVPVE